VGDGNLTQETAYPGGSAANRVTDYPSISGLPTSSYSGSISIPTGWSTPTGGGLNLVTQNVVDLLGRPTEITDPAGNIIDNLGKGPRPLFRARPLHSP
jgi:hypothetical protein